MKYDLDAVFHSDGYLRITRARAEHLISLGLPLQGKSVFEMGAGIGDFTQMLLDQGCHVTTTDMRPGNVEWMLRRFAGNADVHTMLYNVERGSMPNQKLYDAVLCYGLLYHLESPVTALSVASQITRDNGIMMVESCVSHVPPTTASIDKVDEDPEDPSAGMGEGCRPSPKWLWIHMQRLFPFVYAPLTQPDHDEFPLSWEEPPTAGLSRIVLIGSKKPLLLPTLRDSFPETYERYHYGPAQCCNSDLPGPAPVETGAGGVLSPG